ncbi:MAG: carboxymuconolactone decarboxylase family protein [Pseudomonadota bacterium]
MARLAPAGDARQKEVEAELAAMGAAMGFVPNSAKIMAHRPEILSGFLGFAGAILGPGGTLEPALRQMIAHVASAAAGCSYCQAHTAEQAHRAGAGDDKIEALWSYETSPLFSEAERAALSLAQAAASVPNDATDAHFDTLKTHFSAAQVAEIVAVIALFGFLNRWNDTLATPLEDNPLAFAEAHLAQGGWTVGAHARGTN